MNIIYNDKHKKIDTKDLKINNRKKVNVSLGSIVLSLTLLSGCGKIDKNINNDEKAKIDVNTTPSVSDTIVDDDIVEEKNEAIESDNSYSLDNNSEYDLSDTINLPDSTLIVFDDGSDFIGNKIESKDLSRVETVGVVLKKGCNYDFINNLTGLKNLNIYEHDPGNYFDNIDGSKLPEDLSIDILSYGYNGTYTFSYEKFPFIKDVKNIKSLTVGRDSCGYDFSSSYLSSLDNVEEITINIDEFSAITDFNLNTTNLKKLTIKGKPYDIAMFITGNDLKNLNSLGIQLEIENADKVNKLINELDEVYNSIGIDENDSTIDKMDKILIYILNRFTYDPKVNEAAEIGEKADTTKFYNEGELYGSLNNDTQICGNYAAMMYTLCRRAGINNYFLASVNHAWNAVEIGDYYYYVDPTWLDGSTFIEYVPDYNHVIDDYVPTKIVERTAAELIESREYLECLKWYLVDPANFISIDKENSHILAICPVALTLEDIPDDILNRELGISDDSSEADYTYDDPIISYDEENKDSIEPYNCPNLSDRKYKVKFKDKTYTVSAASLFGLLSAVGIGSLKRKRKKQEDTKQDELNAIFNDNSDNFVDDYNKYRNTYR